MRRIAALLLTLLLLTGCTGPRAATEPEYIFRMAENQAEDYPTTVAGRFFADRVAEETNGRIRILVYADALLGDETSVIEQMQFGGIDFSRVSLSPLAELDKRLLILQLPFLYRDNAHKWRVLDGDIGDTFLESLSDLNLTGLAWVDAGARSFYTQHPVYTADDIRGLRIRVQENAMMVRLVESLGAVPVTTRYGEVLSALQTGKVDGAENNLPSYKSTGHYLVAPYMLEDEHIRIPEVFLASAAVLNTLSAKDREIITAAAREAALYQRDLWREYEEKTRAEALEHGCVITALTAEEREKFVSLTEGMYREFAGDAMDVVARIQGM